MEANGSFDVVNENVGVVPVPLFWGGTNILN
jgi:hypothetical protein